MKYLVISGMGLIVAGVIAYAALFFGHSVFISVPLLYLALLLIILLGYVGVLVLGIGVILYSRQGSKKIKIATWSIVVLILLIFIPFPQECTFESDVGHCEAFFPHQLGYWKHAYLTITLQEEVGMFKDVEWESYGTFLFFQEGIGDTIGAIKITSQEVF